MFQCSLAVCPRKNSYSYRSISEQILHLEEFLKNVPKTRVQFLTLYVIKAGFYMVEDQKNSFEQKMNLNFK